MVFDKPLQTIHKSQQSSLTITVEVLRSFLYKQTNLDFPDAAGRAPEKQFCFSPEGADSPYETYFPIACTTVPCLQPIGLAMVD